MPKPDRPKRTVIYDGIRFLRWCMLVVALFQFTALFNEPSQADIVVLLIAILLFLLFWVMRRVEFDEDFIYRVYGNKEKPVPLQAVVRIEKSGVAVNSRKKWRLRYIDKDNKERKFLFLEGNFRSGSVNELIEKVEAVNKDLEVERSYIWNQVEQQKRRRARRKAKKD